MDKIRKYLLSAIGFSFLFCLAFSSVRAESFDYLAYSVLTDPGVANIAVLDTAVSEENLVTFFPDQGEIGSLSPTSESGKIVFTRPSPDLGRPNSSVWIVNAAGGGLADLVDGNYALDYPYAAISPNGQKLAYVRNSVENPGTYHLYSRNIHGSAEVKLSSSFHMPFEISHPVFINDTLILFLSCYTDHQLYDYYLVNTDGSGLVNLTENQENEHPYYPRLGRPSVTSDGFLLYGRQDNDGGVFSDWQIYFDILELPDSEEDFPLDFEEVLLLDNLYYDGINPSAQRDPQPLFMDEGWAFIGTQSGVSYNLYYTTSTGNPYMARLNSLPEPSVPGNFMSFPRFWNLAYESGGYIYIRDMDLMDPYYGSAKLVGAGSSPALDRRGVYLAYANNGVNVKRIGGQSPVKVDPDPSAGYPAFSPDSRWLIYVRENDLYARDIHLEGAPVRLTFSPGRLKQDPVFSPLGSGIFYTGEEDGRKRIYRSGARISGQDIIPAAGPCLNLTPNTYDNYQPGISPDGRQLLFVSTRNQSPELWKMNTDGTGQTVIIAGQKLKNPSYPQFSPHYTDVIGFLQGVPSEFRLAILDNNSISDSGDLSPTLFASGKLHWGRAASGDIDVTRYMPLDAVYNDLLLHYILIVEVNREKLPQSFVLTEKVPDDWLLDEVFVNGVSLPDPSALVNGGKLTLLFGAAGVSPASDLRIDLVFDVSGGSLGSSYWLYGGVSESGARYITSGDSLLTLGEPFLPFDTDSDWIISDSELLKAIDAWANYSRINGWPLDIDDWDAWLLVLVDFWAHGGYEYLPGQGAPAWQQN